MRILKGEIDNVIGALFAVLVSVIMFAPYQSDSTLGSDSLRMVLLCLMYGIAMVVVALSFLGYRRKSKREKITMTFAIFPAIAIVLMDYFCGHGGSSLGGLSIILWIFFCVLSGNAKKQSFRIFRKIWVAICIIGILCFCFYVFNIPIPNREAPYYFSLESEGVYMNYVSYGVSFIFKQGSILRLCGICNEPGYFGTFCALLLCADGIRMKKKSNLVIFIAGLLSFSVAFALIILVYLGVRIIIAIHREKNVGKKVVYLCSALLVTFLYVFVLPNVSTGNYAIDSTLQRLVITSNGISGDTRTNEKLDELFNESIRTAPLFGMGKGYATSVAAGHSLSYKTYIIDYGIIGCLLTWGVLAMSVLYGGSRKNPMIVAYVVVFFVSVYQRPNIIAVQYLVLLLGGVEYVKNNTAAGSVLCSNGCIEGTIDDRVMDNGGKE